MGYTLHWMMGLLLLLSTLFYINADASKPRATLTDAVLTLEPNWSSFVIQEFVTFKCDMNEGEDTDWEYKINKDGREFSPYNTHKDYRLEIRSKGDSGEYQCSGRKKSSHDTRNSNTVSITVLAHKSRATLTAGTTIIPAGGSVTLSCSVEGSAGWNIYWFRSDSVSSEIHLIREGETNRVISVSQGGLYYCRGGRGDPVYYTEESNEVTITETATKPRATLTAQSLIIPVGGSVTLTCSVNPSSSSGWKYYWYRDNSTVDVVSPSNGQISVSQEGLYRCRGGRGNPVYYTEDSQEVQINKIGSVLTVSPSWLSPGASVTLNCEVEHPSAGWSFYWYKAVPDLSEKSSSYELLPDGSGTAQDSYIIHGQTHTAGYVCRAGRGDPEYHTDHSQPKFVWSADVHSAASLTVSPDRVQHFTSDSVSLTCEGNFTEWRVRKFSEDGRLYSDCRRMTGSTCNINTSKSDTAVYWCESGSGEFSSAVNITVQNDGNGSILVSPVHPVTEGASVSLSCSLRTQKILSNVFFYHNDKLIQNDTRGELKISAVSKSDEGFYKCQYSGRESAQSWMSVKVTVSGADSSSSPVWLIVGLVCGVSLIIILLLLLYRCRQSKYADETQDVTYSLIKLKDFEKRRKHHKPEECVIYSEVKTGAAEDSLMYAEVKQPKKEKAKKNKGKSSPAADAAVYSEVTSGSSLSQ
ncbi:unnamed protein product [Oreochromis niloticus]|nr:unnamed protein product [Mustela putorius furo]